MADKTKAEIEKELADLSAKNAVLEKANAGMKEALQKAKEINNAQAAELKGLKVQVAELGKNPLVRVIESAPPTLRAADLPADFTEAQVSAKVKAGLSRKQAITALIAQRDHDARLKSQS